MGADIVGGGPSGGGEGLENGDSCDVEEPQRDGGDTGETGVGGGEVGEHLAGTVGALRAGVGACAGVIRWGVVGEGGRR